MSCWWTGHVGIVDFCETIHTCAPVLQPVATASALAFLPAAALLARRARDREQPALYLLTFATACMGIGTFAQHATGTGWAMLLDHAGMQSANVALVLIGLRRWRGTDWRLLVGLGTLAWLALVPLTAELEAVRRWLVVGGMLPSAALELGLWVRDGARTRYLWWGVGWVLFAAAILSWDLDHRPRFCAPDALFQLHAAWHALSAAALTAWGVYYTQFDTLRSGRSD